MKLLEQIRVGTEGRIAPAGGPVLVGVSGGADSVALLLALQELGFAVEALHCNFELRGAESERDEAFVRKVCRLHNLPLTVKHFRTKAVAQRQGISIEMAARQLRYDWFGQMARRRAAQCICVAHHRDDQAETLLLNLVRGTGIRGLCGMSVCSWLAADKASDAASAAPSASAGVLLLRPLLEVSRTEIEEWLTERGETWVTDSTNRDADAAWRNKIRLEVIPLLAQLNPRIAETLCQTGQRMAEATLLYDKALAGERQQVETTDGIDIAALQNTTASRTVLYEILKERGFGAEQAAEVYEHLDGEPGHEWQSAEWRLLRDRGRLLWRRRTDRFDVPPTVLPLEGLAEVAPGVRLLIRRQAMYAGFEIPRAAHTACFDLEKLSLPLTVRLAAEADRFQPFGMEGTRLVSDLLTDQKLSVFEKERQLVVESGDRIAWVVGRRVAAGFEVDAQTRFVMTITQL